MNTPYESAAQAEAPIEQDDQAETLAQETAEQITGPLTGKEPMPAPKKQAKTRKSASAFRTISEVANELDVQQHVLRFWETKFSQIRPLKRGGGRRYYRPEDLALLKKIHHLLYTEGYTIKGVQKLLKEKGKAALLQEKPAEAQNNNAPTVTTTVRGQVPVSSGTAAGGMSQSQRQALKAMLQDLKDLRAMFKSE